MKTFLISLVLAALGAFALWACGPFFPPWLLTDEAGVLQAPTTWLSDARGADTETARRSRKVNAITNVPDACPADTRVKRGE